MKPCTCGAPATHTRRVLGEAHPRRYCAMCAQFIDLSIDRQIAALESRRPVPIDDSPTLFGES